MIGLVVMLAIVVALIVYIAGVYNGLVGLRERVTELGGQLLAGRTPHGGWLVEATLPS